MSRRKSVDFARDILALGKLHISMAIGEVEFSEKSNRKYPLTAEWFHRGLQIGILRYLIPYQRLEVWSETLHRHVPPAVLSAWYGNLLWFAQIMLFTPQDEVVEKIQIGVSNGLTLLHEIWLASKDIACVSWSPSHLEHNLKHILSCIIQKELSLA